MILLLRGLFFIAGTALLAAPSFLLLQFAYGVAEPPTSVVSAGFFLLPVCIGLLLGGGLLLSGLPHLVVGAMRPATQLVAGLLLATSAVAVALFVGVSGSVTKIVSPAVLLLDVFAFLVFVWPAASFASKATAAASSNDG